MTNETMEKIVELKAEGYQILKEFKVWVNECRNYMSDEEIEKFVKYKVKELANYK